MSFSEKESVEELEQRTQLEWLEGLNVEELTRTAFPPDDFPTFFSPGELRELETLRYFQILFKDHDPMQNPTTPESIKELKVTDLVVEYHKLYALYKKPEYLEIARDLGKVTPDTFDWEKKVNDGCDRQGIPHIYPK